MGAPQCTPPTTQGDSWHAVSFTDPKNPHHMLAGFNAFVPKMFLRSPSRLWDHYSFEEIRDNVAGVLTYLVIGANDGLSVRTAHPPPLTKMSSRHPKGVRRSFFDEKLNLLRRVSGYMVSSTKSIAIISITFCTLQLLAFYSRKCLGP